MTYSLADYSSSKYLAGTNADWGEKNQDMKAAYEARDLDYLTTRLGHYLNGVRAYDIAANPQEYILHVGYFEMNELFDISPPEGSVFVRAATEPFSDDMVQDEKKLTNWLRFFGINEEQDEKIIRHHVSGHASGPDLLQFIADMQPELVIPIHTEKPELFESELKGTADVCVPSLEKEIIVS